MSRESANREPENASSSIQRPQEQEQILAAIALLLGPDTAYHKRQCAARCLEKFGPQILPLLVQTLHNQAEILTPTWPWWPPQYEQISRLLVQLSQRASIPLEALLHYPTLSEPPGPVLWIGIIEAMALFPHHNYEAALRDSLLAPWWTVRYAAALAIANRALHMAISPETRQALYGSQSTDSETPVRLTAACALLRCADEKGLETLIGLLAPEVNTKFRKAALFILATELSAALVSKQKRNLVPLLLLALRDEDHQIILHAARALRIVATPEILPELKTLLEDTCVHTRLAALTACEELANRKMMRRAMQQQSVSQHVASLIHAREPEIRRQACYALASIGGEYTTAVFGTILLDALHPAHLEAIEALRLLPDTQHPSVLTRIVCWLIYALGQPEIIQICALDSLSYLIWRARLQHQYAVLRTITYEMEQSGIIFQLLTSASPWVRQRTVELLGGLDAQLYNQQTTLFEMLHHDSDSTVRACIAYTLGQKAALWAIPDLLLALLDRNTQVAIAALNALGALPVTDDVLIVYAIQELAAYHLPTQNLEEDLSLIRAARIWLKKRQQKMVTPRTLSQQPLRDGKGE